MPVVISAVRINKGGAEHGLEEDEAAVAKFLCRKQGATVYIWRLIGPFWPSASIYYPLDLCKYYSASNYSYFTQLRSPGV